MGILKRYFTAKDLEITPEEEKEMEKLEKKLAKRTEKLVEDNRKAHILTAADYAVTINCRDYR